MIQNQLHAVVIAGGSGTRFWPLSRQHHPKQLLNLKGKDSLLQATFKRVEKLIACEQWWMVVGATHAEGCRQAVADILENHVLIEPQARNTAPAIGLAAIHLLKKSPNSSMVVLPADHHVQNSAAFNAALHIAAQLAELGPIVTLGIKPTHPETGFGYIQQGGVDSRQPGGFRVQRFCEKPQAAEAEKFLAEGNFLWNAGIFVMRPEVYLAEVQRQLPSLYQALRRLEDVIDTPHYASTLKSVYADLTGISMDYGIMENALDTCVVPVDCGWSDVGSWSALGSMVPADVDNNITHGKVVAIDSHNCVLYATPDHVVGVVGMKDVVVVHTPDATLVVPTDRAQEIRHLVQQLGEKNWQQFI